MKIRLCFILFLLGALAVQPLTAQEQTKFNQKNEKGEKVGTWKGYFESGAVRYVGEFKNDKPYGVFYHYYGDGKLQTKMVYRTPNEVYTTMYYSTGEKLAEGKYVNKIKDSTWLTFGANNILLEKGNYENGQKVGVWRTFYETGELSAEMNYQNDLKDGPYRMFYQNGKVKDSSNFIGGKLNGYSVIYDTNGKKIIQGIYKDSRRDKHWVYYGENQKVEKVLKYDNGELLNPNDLNTILEDVEKFSGNRKDVLEYEDLRGTINYE